MKTPKLLLQTALAVVALALPASAQAQQPYPYPSPGYQPMLTPLPASGPLGDALVGTPLDPYATTVHVVPPTGGTVMLYRDNSMRGWWMQEGLISVKPDMLYSLVATRGTTVVFAAGIVFRPGYTEVVWRGQDFPQIAYQPTWPMYPGYGNEQREAARAHPASSHGARAHDERHGAAAPRSAPVAKPPIRTLVVRPSASSTRVQSRPGVRQPATKAIGAESAHAVATDPNVAPGKALRKPAASRKAVAPAGSAKPAEPTGTATPGALSPSPAKPPPSGAMLGPPRGATRARS
jgi:hypothetical protein